LYGGSHSPYARAVYRCRKQKELWMDDRAAMLERVAELAGDRFSWLTRLGQGVVSLGTDDVMGDHGIACAGAAPHVTPVALPREQPCVYHDSFPPAARNQSLWVLCLPASQGSTRGSSAL
jgi:hypothetical protein